MFTLFDFLVYKVAGMSF